MVRKQEERQQEVVDTAPKKTLEPSETLDTALRETLESSETVDAGSTETLESSEADIASDELSCELCEHRSQTNGGLKEIPQLDGQVQIERVIDDWWGKKHHYMCKVIKDVQQDITESNLSENESILN